jgi:D-cysteine desulfhydrase
LSRLGQIAPGIPHVSLGEGPTPVRELDDGLWVKDESGYGTHWGGNKVRKLEFILPDAKRRGKRTILTFGALATNHGLATALYAREQGLRCALGLVNQPVDDHVRAQLERLRNSGATLHFTRTRRRTIAAVPWLMLRHRLPYLLPAGGSSPVGVLGWVEGGLEIAEQVREGAMPEPSHVVCAVGTGGTAAGLLLGLTLGELRTKVLAVVVNDKLTLDHPALVELASKAARLAGTAAPDPERLVVTRDFLGPGYGVPTPESEAAMAGAGGLDLDPVYTAKAMAAALAFEGAGPLLFLQTHGPR